MLVPNEGALTGEGRTDAGAPLAGHHGGLGGKHARGGAGLVDTCRLSRSIQLKSAVSGGPLLPQLYLHGLALGDFELALRGLLGDGAPLSAASLARLKAKWQLEYEAWKQRRLDDLEIVYVWADGLYVKAGLEDSADHAYRCSQKNGREKKAPERVTKKYRGVRASSASSAWSAGATLKWIEA